MDDEIEIREGVNLFKVFTTTFVISLAVVFVTYNVAGFEVAVLIGICFISGTISMVGVGVENILTNEVRNQIVRLRCQLKGYLTDIYSEMVGGKKN